MKPFAWMFSLLSLFCVTSLVCTATPIAYPLADYDEYNMIQNDYFMEKRNKPSLSIVNPLDVLRQRLLLEIARRQMKENTRQVELNRAILKNVGKRTSQSAYRHELTYVPEYQVHLLEQDSSNKKTPLKYYEYEVGKPSSIIDAYQRPPSKSSALVTDIDETDDKNSLNNARSIHNNKDIENENNRSNFETMVMPCEDCAPINSITSGKLAATTNGYHLRYPYQLHKTTFDNN